MMSKVHGGYMIVILFVLFSVTYGSGSTSGSRDNILHKKASTGRSILQAPQDCPVNVETLNYNNLTSQCKKPYEAQPCCSALKELACPYADQFNDLTNNCATLLFRYIKFLNYSDGLFANICSWTKQGLPCPETTSETSTDTNAAQRSSHPFHELMILVPTFLHLLLLRF